MTEVKSKLEPTIVVGTGVGWHYPRPYSAWGTTSITLDPTLYSEVWKFLAKLNISSAEEFKKVFGELYE